MDKKELNSNGYKTYSLDYVKDKYIGKTGTPEREQYEFDLNLDVLGTMIKTARKAKNLTQSELGELVGVKKSHISKLENNSHNVSIDTVFRVLTALKAKVRLKLELED